ncbi:DNA-binding transcriptional activator of the SARP family [Asanoa ishikariensis]|uniref:DNA-binding transcriptional activator of the SARP family n=1 Tax=Asanoa ishikariensis TaxID=137265 RepID=A0A1H3QY96_9ACTN|nr:BTAD domain-containing putative transcriptional regulator [Asanoa ishikariensis]SDZ18514.1 DNA-binding transcriptional activator of the SARP family [Asanoa ishikariensis]
MSVGFGVLGPVVAWSAPGEPVDLRGPRHRAVLARLLVANGRVVPVDRLVDDLWTDPPTGAVSAVRTFVAALRRALEPDRAPRTPPRLLVTEGPGYALRVGADAVDAWRFEAVVAARPSPERLGEALGWWRGPAYAGLDEPWARDERARLEELRLHAVELRAEALLGQGRAADVVPDLDAHVAGHPWREDAWRLLAEALWRANRQADALAVLRRARDLLREQLGIDPGPSLRRLESDILRQASPSEAEGIWAAAAAAYDRTVTFGAPARLESTVDLLRGLAVGGGLEAARGQRLATVEAAERLGDPELTARVIGGYDVPAIWTRSDDPAQAAAIVAAAERTLAALPPAAPDSVRARLLATVAIESRGTDRHTAAREAERLARPLGDPGLLVFVLNGRFMQSFQHAGLAAERDRIGAELTDVSAAHGLASFEILGHLVRMQARAALADFATADQHAAAADRLAERHGRPLVGAFTRWYAALRLAATGAPAEAAYRAAAADLSGAGMPGVERGLLPLALLCLRVWHGQPIEFAADTDWGPYEPWVRPLTDGAALRVAPEPPHDLLFEALWCLLGEAAIRCDDRDWIRRAHTALAAAAGELAGAGSGMLTVGPIDDHLARLDAALAR